MACPVHDSALTTDPAGEANLLITRAVRRVYQWGRWVAGSALVLGLILHVVGGQPVTFARAPDGLAPTWFNGALLILWVIPVASLLTAAVGWLKRRPGDPVGWLSVLIVGFLVSLWVV